MWTITSYLHGLCLAGGVERVHDAVLQPEDVQAQDPLCSKGSC